MRGLLILLSVLCCAPPLYAVDSLVLELGDLAGAGWRLRNVQISLDSIHPAGGDAEIRIARAELAALPQASTRLRLDCPRLVLTAARLACNGGNLNTSVPLFDELRADFEYRFDNSELTLAAERTRKDGRGSFKIDAHVLGAGWRLALETHDLDLAQVQQAAAGFTSALADWSFAGKADLRAQVRGGGGGSPNVSVHGEVNGFSYANAAGTQAGENLRLTVDLDPLREPGWSAALALALHGGELYSDPFYFQYQARAPLRFSTRIAWHEGALRLWEVFYKHPGVGEFKGDTRLNFNASPLLRELHLVSGALDVASLYRTYVSNYLSDRDHTPLDVDGSLSLRVAWNETRREAHLALTDFSLYRAGDEGGDSLLLTGIEGDLHWHAEDRTPPAPSRIQWRGANLPPTVAVGPGTLELLLHGESIHLLESFTLPVLDGGLRIDTFRLEKILSEEPAVEFSGMLQPISMPALSAAFGWPELGGQISGMVPELRYNGKRLDIGGALLVKVFGGDIVIHGLALNFGKPTRMRADIKLDNLDLHTLTRFFSFGEITGLISGYIKDLHMSNWQPVAFDAFFATPEEDKSKHLISQKAINNLSSLGGSQVTKVLSRSVLRIFNDFSYERLGWGCRLHNGLCNMRGIARAEGGYYIVKGSRLPPRIDVLGYNQRVDWNDLLKRLKSVTAVGTPVFE